MKRLCISICFISLIIFSNCGKEKPQSSRVLPPVPQYFSEGQAPDQGVLKPVENTNNEQIRIAFLGLETNQWWAPVKHKAGPASLCDSSH